jgi:hypothetical protein
MGLADDAAGTGDCFRLGRFGGRGHGWIPIEQAAAAIAGEQFAFAKLIPGLRTNTHAAAGALLVVDAGEAGAARAAEAIITHENFRLDQRAEGFALSVECDESGGVFLMAEGHAGSGCVEGGGERFNQGAGGGERGFLGFSALEACKFLIFEAVSFGGLEGNFVLDGVCLLRGLHRVELHAETLHFLAVSSDFAVKAGSERLLAGDGRGGFGGLALGGSESGLSLGDFSGKGAESKGETGALQVDALQSYEIFDFRMHR